MKTHDELWAENMALLEPTTMTQMDKDYVCGILVRKDAMYQYASAILDIANRKNFENLYIETVKIVEETA